MRTIKFLGLAAALAAVSVSANAQGGRGFDHFVSFNELARVEARQIERRQMHQMYQMYQMRRFAMARAAQFGQRRGRRMMTAARMGQHQSFQQGRRRAGMKLGGGAGVRAGARANATPEQQAFAKQFGEQRQAIRAQVQAGSLTREQARAQMKAWAVEHRPKK